MEFDPDLMIPDTKLSINEGAIVVLGWQSCNDGKSFTNAVLRALAEEYHFSLDTPFQDYSDEIKDLLLYGKNSRPVKVHYKGQRGEGVYDITFEGLIKNVQRRYRETGGETTKAEYETFMTITPCEECKGKRLKPTALAVTIADKNIDDLTRMSIEDLTNFMDNIKLTDRQMLIGGAVLKEIRARLHFLIDVGLDYLALYRSTGTLSGGEAQRIRLATQIGSGLVGVAYILDEPSIGLHSRDTERLIHVLRELQALGNTVVVVEHDEEIIRAADYIIDIGPKAGRLGGEVVYQGDVDDLKSSSNSYTVRYLTGED